MASTRFVIHWKSKVNGRVGRGSKLFTSEEAHQLVEELNREYPEIEHNMVPASEDQPAADNIVQLSREPLNTSTEADLTEGEERPPGATPAQDPEAGPGKIISTAE